MAERVDLRVEAGTTFSKPYGWYAPLLDAAGKLVLDADGNPQPNPAAPINLTGYTARMHIRRRLADVDTQLVLTTENGRLVLGGAAGTVRIVMLPVETAALLSGVYDLELVAPVTGVVTRLMSGKVRVSAEVTR